MSAYAAILIENSLRPSESSEQCLQRMFKLNAKCDADSFLYSLSHFECDSHMVHNLTQQHLPPLVTNAVMSSLFTYEHSSPFSLAARLHQCRANHSYYINNGWVFPRQTSYSIQYHP